jgi:hypothetical protein
MRFAVCVVVLGVFGTTVVGQAPARPPVIDMHVHSTNITPQQTLERMKQLNIRYLFVSTLRSDLARWASVLDRNQFVAGLVFPCDHGRGPYNGASCFDSDTEFPDVAWLRAELRAGRITALGELEPQ